MKNKLMLPLLCLAAALHAEVKAIKNFVLIDGTGRAAAPKSAMLVDNGRISWIGPASRLSAPSGAETIDLHGKYVMPGMIGLHVHLGTTQGLTQDAKFFTPENRQRVLDSLEKIRPIAEKHKATFAQLIVNWTVHQPGITAALVGARDAEQAKQNAGAMNLTLSNDELKEIRAAFDETSRVMTH